MKTQLFRSTFLLFCLIAIITCYTFNPAVATDLNVGEPRTVRLIYFLPNDRPYRAEVVQRMKDEILGIQNFFADMMEAHGYGRLTFRVETDTQGIPIVHRVDGQHPDSRYFDDDTLISQDIKREFNRAANIHFIVIDNGRGVVVDGLAGVGWGDKEGGFALVSGNFPREVGAHELGHAFGLWHDFRDGTYIMSYGRGPNVGTARRGRLSACAAEFLSVHPYFNPDTPIEKGEPPTVELMSLPGYLANTKNIRIKFRVSANDSAGLHQVRLFNFVDTHVINNDLSMIACRGLAGERVAIVEFDYDQVFDHTGFSFSVSALPSHRISVKVVDTNGNVGTYDFDLVQIQDPTIAPIEVDIPDLKLRASIENALGKASGATITAQEMAVLVRLNAPRSAISDLTGLEFATNLTHLALDLNSITDISVVSGLTNLTHLGLGGNSITDISAVSGLTNLTDLSLNLNSITDISAVSGLTNLTELRLRENSISDLSPLAGLTNLTLLSLAENSITDISAVSGLTSLTELYLESNSITDISAVSGLTSLTHLFLEHNPIEDTAVLCLLIEQNKYVDIEIDCQPIEIDIPDLKLRASIENALGKASGATITAQEMAVLVRLDAQGSAISDLTGLETATNLTALTLRKNSISDLSPLAGLTNLTRLFLERNPITDISPLAGLTNLTELRLYINDISDLSPLSGLTNLTGLTLSSNFISDLSPLSGLTNLTWLYLGTNYISDLSPLAGLTNLTELRLYNNYISDLSSLSGLTNLTKLELWDNNISDLSPLSGLTNLTKLELWNNNISDLSPLVKNAGLGNGDTVDAMENPLSAASINTHIPALLSRGVTVEFEDQAHPAILKLSGDYQNGAASSPLPDPFVIEAQDENGAALAGISITFTVTSGGGTLSVTSATTDANGTAENTLTLGPNLGTNTVEVSADGVESTVTFYAIADTESPAIPADVNGDGVVNILDLVSVVSKFGSAGTNLAADVNGDGVVNILDLVSVAGMFGTTAAAPSAGPQVTLTTVEVQGWLTDARTLEVRDPIMKRGIMVLEQLLVSLTPRETELLSNYPNPFNPETWIPYRLATDADVRLTIYDTKGEVVRQFDLGHQTAGYYTNRAKAAYWDGRNHAGEPVGSGVYFYQLTAGDYSATRKMVILK